MLQSISSNHNKIRIKFAICLSIFDLSKKWKTRYTLTETSISSLTYHITNHIFIFIWDIYAKGGFKSCQDR